MEPTEQAQRLTTIIESNRHFENLLANEDFLKWRDSNLLPYLESIQAAVLGVDRSQPGWKEAVCDGVVAYQEAKKSYDTLFQTAARTASHARKQLGELSKAQGQSS